MFDPFPGQDPPFCHKKGSKSMYPTLKEKNKINFPHTVYTEFRRDQLQSRI